MTTHQHTTAGGDFYIESLFCTRILNSIECYDENYGIN